MRFSVAKGAQANLVDGIIPSNAAIFAAAGSVDRARRSAMAEESRHPVEPSFRSFKAGRVLTISIVSMLTLTTRPIRSMM